MSAELRSYFFGPLLDKLKNGDIPTEDTFRKLLDSHAFFRELSDTAARTKGGLVKTTPDTKVNDRDGSDVAGVSPLGYKTFVQPQQIFKVLAGANVTIVDVPRTASGADDSGEYIIDKRIDVTIPPIPPIPSTAADLTVSAGIAMSTLAGAYPYTVSANNIAGGSTIQAALVQIAAEVTNIVTKANTIADELYADQVEAVGSIDMTMAPSGTWGAKYMEPTGQVLAVASYPELFAKIGYTYGGAGANFVLPNLTAASYLRGVINPSASVGTITGLDDYSLTAANIPEHDHTFSGTTDPDGSHKHDIQIATSVAGTNLVDGSAGAYAGTDSTAISTEPDHTHTFSGTTDPYGSNPVTPIPLTPKAFNVYLKMRVLP